MVTNYLDPEPETYFDPEFNEVEVYDPPQVDPDELRLIHHDDFTRRFSKFNGGSPPKWRSVVKMFDENQLTDPELRFQTFTKWFNDFRDWHIYKGLLDPENVPKLVEQAMPVYNELATAAQASKLQKRNEANIPFIKEQFPGFWGERLAANESENALFGDIYNAVGQGLLNREAADEARIVSYTGEIAKDMTEKLGDPDAFQKVISGDVESLKKLQQKLVEEREAVLQEEESTVGMRSESVLQSKVTPINDKIAKIQAIIDSSSRGSNPLEKFTRISEVAANVRVGKELEAYQKASKEGTTFEKFATTVVAAPELAAQSIAQSADVLAASAVGSLVGGPALSAVLAGAFSYDMDQAAEFADLVQEEIQRRAEEKKIDPTDRAAIFDISKEVFGDTAFITSAQETASKHAAPVAALDAAGAAIGAGAFSRFGRLGRTLGAVAIDPTLGGLGEAGGQLAAYGSIRDVSGVFAEIVPGVGTSLAATLADTSYWKNSEQTKAVQLTETPVVPTPEVKKTSLRDKIKASAPVVEEKAVDELAPPNYLNWFKENAPEVQKGQRALEAVEQVEQKLIPPSELEANIGRKVHLAELMKVEDLNEKFNSVVTKVEQPTQEGMSVKKGAKKQEGGFVDLEAIAQGIGQAATNLYQTAKDFTEWSAGLVKQFGEKVQPFLKALWEKIGYAVDFFTPTQSGRFRQGGSIINPANQVVAIGRMDPIQAGAGLRFSISDRTVYNAEGTVQRIGSLDVSKSGVVNFNAFRKQSGISNDEIELYKTISPESFQGNSVNVNQLTQDLKNKGPVLEVKTLIKYEGKSAEESAAIVQHWLDSNRQGWRFSAAANNIVNEQGDLISNQDEAALPNEIQERLADAQSMLRTGLPPGAHYSSIAPKPESQMPGYVEGLVRIPISTEGVTSPRPGRIDTGLDVKYHGPHFGEEDVNVVSFFRGYEETMSDGSKAFHVIEVQSDWAQKVRAAENDRRPAGGISLDDGIRIANSPLLRAYETLALKSAINHARSVGANSIIISDAETAMMTEGHDRAAVHPLTGDYTGTPGTPSYRPIIKQEPGMRLHYDKILPDIAKKLTKDDGKKVNLGEHKESIPDSGLGRIGSPAFKEGGKPKTSVTGNQYSLAKAPVSFRLYADPFGLVVIYNSLKTAFEAAKSIAQFTSNIVSQFGEWITPHAQKLWDAFKSGSESAVQSVIKSIPQFQSTERGKPESQVRNVISKKLKAVDAPKELRKLVKSFASRFLSPEDQKKMLKLADDYVAGKQGKTVGLPTESIMRGMHELKAKADQKEFEFFKQKNPQLLGDKTLADFNNSIRDVKGFLVRDPSAKGLHKPISKERRAELKDARLNAIRNDIRTQIGKLDSYLNSDEFNDLTPAQQAQVEESLEAIIDADIDNFPENTLRDTLQALNNLIEDNDHIGIGRFATSRKKEGDILTFTEVAGKDPSKMFGVPAATPDVLKFQTVADRVVSMTKDAWKAWLKLYAPYNQGLANADSLHRRMAKILDRAVKRLPKEGQLTSLYKIQIVAQLSQWRDAQGVQDIIDAFNGIQQTLDVLHRADDEFLRLDGMIAQKAFDQLVSPFTVDEEGNITFDGDPEELADSFEFQLNEKERDFLNEIRGEFASMQPDVKFTKEFWVGEEFEQWNRYYPRLAKRTFVKAQEINQVDLEESSVKERDSESGRPLETTEGTLKERKGLAEGQYYELNTTNVTNRAFKQQAYDIHTWQHRSAMKQFFTSKEMKKAMGEARMEALHNSVRNVHLGYNGAGTLADTMGGAAFERAVNIVISKMLSSVSQMFKQGVAPWLSAMIAESIFGDPATLTRSTIDYLTDISTNNKWLEATSPEIFHRFEEENVALDKIKPGGRVHKAIAALGELSFHELTSGQKAQAALFGTGRFLSEALGWVPMTLTKWVVQKPDAVAARMIFRSQYIQQLIKKGVIQNYSQFNTQMPVDAEAAYAAKVITQNYMNSPSSARERADLFNTPDKRKRMVARMFSLAQSTLYSAGDRITDIKALTYEDNSPEGKAFKRQHQKQITAAILQNMFFLGFGMLVDRMFTGGAMVNLIASLFHREEPEDDDKKRRVSVTKKGGVRISPLTKTKEEQYKEELDLQIALHQRIMMSPSNIAGQLLHNTLTTFIPAANNPLTGGLLLNNAHHYSDLTLTEGYHKDIINEINARLSKPGVKKEEKEYLEFEKKYHQALINKKRNALRYVIEVGQYSFVESEITNLGNASFTPQGILGAVLSTQSSDFAKSYGIFRKAEKKLEQSRSEEERAARVKELSLSVD